VCLNVWALGRYFGMTVVGPLPDKWTILRDYVLSFLFTDTTFYWSHRLLHHRWG
jgi:sterol desaturase/sphingolipid hydroxylase (fatty acid hydroxylase superfamily)